MPIAVNPSGDAVFLAPDGSWQPAQKAVNPQTKETLVHDGQNWVPLPAATKPDIGRVRSLLEGVRSGITANFGDELAGLNAASGLPPQAAATMNAIPGGQLAEPIIGAARLGYEALTGSGGATEAYNKARDEVRGAAKQAQEQHPGYYIGGNVAGAVALPGGAALQAATLPARIGRSAAVGTTLGGIAGIGEGETIPDRAAKGATGAALGGAVGAVAAPALEGILQAGRAVAQPVVNAVRGAIRPQEEAARRIVTALDRDVQADPNAVNRLTANEFAGSIQNNGPARIIDIGGETTRALARSAANTSPEGRAALNQTINDRFEGQTGRVNGWLENTFNYPNAFAQQEALKTAASAANNPAYRRALQAGDRPIWDNTLESLAEDPTVLAAMRRASIPARAAETQQGIRPFKQPFEFTGATATLKKDPNGNTIQPNLQYWDLVKRELDKGDRNSQLFSKALRDHLDTIVPEYGVARAGAAHFFGAGDALEAGQNYVASNFATPEARRALAQMSPTERQLFQDGFVSRLVETLNKTGDRRSVLNQIANSPAAREKLNVALGPQRATELEAGLRVEGIMDLARGAVQGNSTTARQLAEIGLAGGASGLAYYEGLGPREMGIAAIVGALTARGGRAIGGRIDERVARQVAQMLVSNDPTVLTRGINVIARSGTYMNALRAADTKIAAAGSEQVPTGILPSMQAAGTGRADENQPSVPRPPGQ